MFAQRFINLISQLKSYCENLKLLSLTKSSSSIYLPNSNSFYQQHKFQPSDFPNLSRPACFDNTLFHLLQAPKTSSSYHKLSLRSASKHLLKQTLALLFTSETALCHAKPLSFPKGFGRNPRRAAAITFRPAVFSSVNAPFPGPPKSTAQVVHKHSANANRPHDAANMSNIIIFEYRLDNNNKATSGWEAKEKAFNQSFNNPRCIPQRTSPPSGGVETPRLKVNMTPISISFGF